MGVVWFKLTVLSAICSLNTHGVPDLCSVPASPTCHKLPLPSQKPPPPRSSPELSTQSLWALVALLLLTLVKHEFCAALCSSDEYLNSYVWLMSKSHSEILLQNSKHTKYRDCKQIMGITTLRVFFPPVMCTLLSRLRYTFCYPRILPTCPLLKGLLT